MKKKLRPNFFFEQYVFYEVLRFKFLLESEQPNLIYSRDLQAQKSTENVSKSRISCHAPMGLIIYERRAVLVIKYLSFILFIIFSLGDIIFSS